MKNNKSNSAPQKTKDQSVSTDNKGKDNKSKNRKAINIDTGVSAKVRLGAGRGLNNEGTNVSYKD